MKARTFAQFLWEMGLIKDDELEPFMEKLSEVDPETIPGDVEKFFDLVTACLGRDIRNRID